VPRRGGGEEKRPQCSLCLDRFSAGRGVLVGGGKKKGREEKGVVLFHRTVRVRVEGSPPYRVPGGKRRKGKGSTMASLPFIPLLGEGTVKNDKEKEKKEERKKKILRSTRPPRQFTFSTRHMFRKGKGKRKEKGHVPRRVGC